jgi:hypothetical protein
MEYDWAEKLEVEDFQTRCMRSWHRDLIEAVKEIEVYRKANESQAKKIELYKRVIAEILNNG